MPSPTQNPSFLSRELIDVPRREFVRLPDTQVIERPGWLQIIPPSLRQEGLNKVSLSVPAPSEVDQVIDVTLGMYARHDLSFRRSVTPDCLPLDLPERLERRGMLRSETRAMYRDTAPMAVETNGGADVR